jgi:hypothetical protein
MPPRAATFRASYATLALALVALLAPGASTCLASGDDVAFAIGFRAHSSDALLAGDNLPRPLSAIGGGVEFQVRIRPEWYLTASGRLAGSWFEYRNSLDLNGNFRTLEPSLRVGADRVLQTAGVTPVLMIGAGFEYGEVRSWLHNNVYNQPVDQSGPQNWRHGVYLRGVYCLPRDWPWVPFVELSESAFMAHARSGELHEKFDWNGRGQEAAIGLRFRIPPGGD